MTATKTAAAYASTFEAAKELAKAYFTANPGAVAPEDVPGFVARIHDSLLAVAATSVDTETGAPAEVQVLPQAPAVPVEQSVTADGEWLVCLEDGTKHKMMKRYLMRVFGMTPEQYRTKWGLPADYPMTAPAYSAQKRAEAEAVGLGTKENKTGARMAAAA